MLIASADATRKADLGAALRVAGWQVSEVSGGAEAILALQAGVPDVLLVDEWLPDLQVEELTTHLARGYPELELLRLDQAYRAQDLKRSDHAELLFILRKLQAPEAASESDAPSTALITPDASPVPSGALPELLPGMAGESQPIREVAALIRLVAPRRTTVLIEGETGTGKEVVASAIHRLSSRADQSFVVINCAAIPEALLEAELFGYTKGAFTGAVQSRVGRIETAHGGTLFLDEIGELPLGVQAKLLRFLESGEIQRVGDNALIRVDVRVVAATHQPLETRANEGTFRLDLYHRLAVFPVELPALRERLGDLAGLANYLLMRSVQGGAAKHLSAAAHARLAEHHWPGNVRELMHVLERAVILSAEQETIDAEHIRYRRTPR